MLKNTESSYGLIAKLLHWIIAIAIIIMLIVGLSMQYITDPIVKQRVYAIHKATGSVVFFLISIRFVWHLINVKVALPNDLPKWQKISASVNINALYLLMFLMPISGFLMTILSGRNISIYGLFTINSFLENKPIAKIFKETHEYSAFLLCALIILHILATIHHHFIRKDNVFKRMWF